MHEIEKSINYDVYVTLKIQPHATQLRITNQCCNETERLKDGNIHMCFFSRSGYRPLINPPRP